MPDTITLGDPELRHHDRRNEVTWVLDPDATDPHTGEAGVLELALNVMHSKASRCYTASINTQLRVPPTGGSVFVSVNYDPLKAVRVATHDVARFGQATLDAFTRECIDLVRILAAQDPPASPQADHLQAWLAGVA